jgi:carbon storage regulator
MLLLSRRINEKIVIGDRIMVTVKQINGCQVQLGIEAPEEIPIWRYELLERMQPSEPEKPSWWSDSGAV